MNILSLLHYQIVQNVDFLITSVHTCKIAWLVALNNHIATYVFDRNDTKSFLMKNKEFCDVKLF